MKNYKAARHNKDLSLRHPRLPDLNAKVRNNPLDQQMEQTLIAKTQGIRDNKELRQAYKQTLLELQQYKTRFSP